MPKHFCNHPGPLHFAPQAALRRGAGRSLPGNGAEGRGADRQPWRKSPRQRQSLHLYHHDRRAQPRGYVGPQGRALEPAQYQAAAVLRRRGAFPDALPQLLAAHQRPADGSLRHQLGTRPRPRPVLHADRAPQQSGIRRRESAHRRGSLLRTREIGTAAAVPRAERQLAVPGREVPRRIQRAADRSRAGHRTLHPAAPLLRHQQPGPLQPEVRHAPQAGRAADRFALQR